MNDVDLHVQTTKAMVAKYGEWATIAGFAVWYRGDTSMAAAAAYDEAARFTKQWLRGTMEDTHYSPSAVRAIATRARMRPK